MDSSTKDEVVALVVDNSARDETVVLELKKHWMFLADALFLCAISVPFVFPLIITGPFFFYKLARYNKDKVVITDKKFDVRIGLISVDSVSTPLNKINNFHYSQGFLDVCLVMALYLCNRLPLLESQDTHLSAILLTLKLLWNGQQTRMRGKKQKGSK